MSDCHRQAWSALGSGLLVAAILSACTTGTASVDQPDLVGSLHKTIQERDKRIAELESQLKALKVIDQDIERRRKPARPPATLTPVE